MLTNNDAIPMGYLVTYAKGGTQVVKDFPEGQETKIRSIEPLYRRIERRGFTDRQLIAFCEAQDAMPEVQEYLVAASRRVMGELQKLDNERILRKPTLPECLRKKVDVPEHTT